MGRLFAYFVKLFESDPRWLVRVGAAGACGLILAVYCAVKGFWQGRIAFSISMIIAMLIGIPAFWIVGGAFLASADMTRRRLRAGEPVGVVSRVLFGAGVWSLLFWFILLLIVGFPLAIWLGNVTWNRPPG